LIRTIRQKRLQGRWFRQFLIIVMYYFIDYLSTIYHCKSPYDEWNLIARYLMISFNVPLGMTIFFLGISVMWYLVIIPISRITENTRSRHWRNLFEYINIVVFASNAGWDFGYGATSWFWSAPLFIRILSGSILYLIIDFLWIK